MSAQSSPYQEDPAQHGAQAPGTSVPSGQQPGVPGYAPITPTRSVNVMGRISLGIMIVSVLLTQVVTVIGLRLAPTMGFVAYSQITWAIGLGTTVLSVAALVLGIIGLVRPGLPRGAAAAGTALAATALLSTLLNLVLTATY